jgi:hypothetical protein
METYEGDMDLFTRDRAGDEKLAIRFFVKAAQDMEKTREAGRAIFNEVEFIQIVIPGDRNNVIVRPVMDIDKRRFERQYEHWKKTNDSEAVIGTPLEAWGVLNLGQVEEFRYLGVRSVEHMADLHDDLVGKIMGAAELKRRAQLFIMAAKENAPLQKMQGELEKRDNDIAALQKAVDDQAAIIKQLQKKLAA